MALATALLLLMSGPVLSQDESPATIHADGVTVTASPGHRIRVFSGPDTNKRVRLVVDRAEGGASYSLEAEKIRVELNDTVHELRVGEDGKLAVKASPIAKMPAAGDD